MVGELRLQHPWFKYRSSNWEIVGGFLQLEWKFVTEPDLEFSPTMFIPLPENDWQQRVPTQLIDQLVFHIGLVEMLSYWKATASPNIIIQAGYLSDAQLTWWHTFLLKSMGEFFYLNQINFSAPDFVIPVCTAPHQVTGEQVAPVTHSELESRFLVPIGGGKDSIVAMELLRQWRQHEATPVKPDQLTLFAVNPTAATTAVIAQSGFPTILVQRNLDPNILELNQQGFLNGHTPFSALLSFISLLTATLHGFSSTVLGNEQSANEGNVQYYGQIINHQFSKSFEYEASFNSYVATHLQPQSEIALPSYFSLLRPFNELQIAQIFSQMAEAYLPIFRSCNRGQKTNSWCCECAKCLFAYTILFPFLGEQQMVSIFGKNLFENTDLLKTALDLIGKTKNKPFDCVGTYQESQAAFYLCYRWYVDRELEIPSMLTILFEQHVADHSKLNLTAKSLLSQYNEENLIPKTLSQFLRIVCQK
jgi:hypothetical protein